MRSAGLDETMGLDLTAANVMQPLRLNVILKCVTEKTGTCQRELGNKTI